MKKKRLLFLSGANDSAVGYYRSRVPARALRAAGYDVTHWEEGSWYRVLRPTPERWMADNMGEFDLLFTDREAAWETMGLLAGFRHNSPGCRMVTDTDDLFTNVPVWNKARRRYKSGQTFEQVGLAHFRLSEVVTVSTQPLADAFESYAHLPIHVCQNLIDPADWDALPADPERRCDPALRIFYGGASGHFGDLAAARPGLERLLDDPPCPIRLICFAAIPAWLHEVARRHPKRVITLEWVDFKTYPQAVAWGGFDVAIAPLEPHPFNQAKSSIKFLEAAIQGIPFLCSRVGPYADIPDGCAIRVANTEEEWYEGLRALLTDPALRDSLRLRAYEAVRDQWTIDRAAETWQPVIEDALSRPRIDSLAASAQGILDSAEPTDLPPEPPGQASQP
jgi:glycosyltransferase involved in cell wall biosynthesis